jgi:hypothetical protein
LEAHTTPQTGTEVTDNDSFEMDSAPYSAQIIDITPAMAAGFLRRNTHNRNINMRYVADTARDMAAGNWQANGEAFKIAKDGTVLDGQHRFEACVRSGVTLKNMLLVTGLDASTQDTMDSGRKRTAADMYSIRGEENAPILAAVLKLAYWWSSGARRFTANYSPTKSELDEMLAKHPEIRRAVQQAAYVRAKNRNTIASVNGLAYWVFTSISQDDGVWFFQGIATSANLAEFDPVNTLNRRLSNDRADGVIGNPTRVMSLYVSAWNAKREGRELRKIQYTPGQNIPEPK